MTTADKILNATTNTLTVWFSSEKDDRIAKQIQIELNAREQKAIARARRNDHGWNCYCHACCQ